MSKSKKRIKVAFKLLSLGNDGYHLLVRAQINGLACKLVLDTGASKTVIDKKWFEVNFANLKAEVQAFQTTGLGVANVASDAIVLQSLKLHKNWDKSHQIALLDLQNIVFTYENMGIKNVIGVLGCDVLVMYKGKLMLNKEYLSLACEST